MAKTSDQKSFTARKLSDFGIPDAGEDELIDAINIMRANKEARDAYNAAHKKITKSIPDVEEPTRIAIGDVAEVICSPVHRNGYQVKGGNSVTKRVKML